MWMQSERRRQPPKFCPAPPRCWGNPKPAVHFWPSDDFFIVSDLTGRSHSMRRRRIEIRLVKLVHVNFLLRLFNGMNSSSHFKLYSTGVMGGSHFGLLLSYAGGMNHGLSENIFSRRSSSSCVQGYSPTGRSIRSTHTASCWKAAHASPSTVEPL